MEQAVVETTGSAVGRRKQIAVSLDVWLEMMARCKAAGGGTTFDSLLRGMLGMGPRMDGRRRTRPVRPPVVRPPRLPSVLEVMGVGLLEAGQQMLVPEDWRGHKLPVHSVRVMVSRLNKAGKGRWRCAERQGGTMVTRVE